MDDKVMGGLEGRPTLCDELSGIQLKTAMQVSLHQPMSLSQLSEKLGVSSPSASVMVDRLVDKEVLLREPDPQDRRRVQLRVHPRVQSDMDEMHHRFHQAFEHIATRMGNEAIDHWYAAIQQLDLLLQEESA
jgi:DNA-binding MarR family transcriptional regulator